MSIDKNRGDFLGIIVIALLATAASMPTPLTIVCSVIMIGCAAVLFVVPERRAGYALGGLAVASSGVASVALLGLVWDERPLPVSLGVAAGAMALTAVWLVQSWNHRLPVRYGQQVSINTIFGMRTIRGPTRIRRPRAWLGSRIISSISLRRIKSTVRALEIDVRPAPPPTGATIRVLRPEAFELAGAWAPTKIHAIELSVSYSINGDRWYLLYNVPHHEAHIDAAFDRPLGRDRPEYWEAIAAGYILEETPEVLRQVVQREGWGATAVRDERAAVAAQLLGSLRAAAAEMGIVVHQVELLTVDVDAPEALRAARNSGVYGQEAAENLARAGSIRIGLQRQILASVGELLRDPSLQLSSEAIASIVRSQIRALAPAADFEDLLEETMSRLTGARRGPGAGEPRTQRQTRDAA